ncbi:PREDICTED: nicotinamidase-like [Polistes dominula]|uniref:nicotinamidase n=1 Tax=Polistes dominula TaxID=743375 RepID=A0ABM1IYI2_POLDO|nr:PREDICTED: nicotinamidase-like [Polistes dominula]
MKNPKNWKSADNVFKKFDINEDGVLDEQEFILLCKELFEEEIIDNKWRVEDIFKKLHTNEESGLKGKDWDRCFKKWIQPIVNPVNVLVVVDVQNDFIHGSLALHNCKSKHDGYEVIEPINNILSKVDWNKVVYTLDYHPENHISFYENLHLRELHPTSQIKQEKAVLYDKVTFLKPHVKQTLWPKHCVMGTPGSELHQDLHILPKSIQICKGQNPDVEAYSVFTRDNEEACSEMESVLSKIQATDLYVCGLALDVCVKETCLDALKLGYKVILIEDCCRGIDNDEIIKAKNAIVKNGGLIIKSEEVYTFVNDWKRSLILAHHAANKLSEKISSQSSSNLFSIIMYRSCTTSPNP